MERELHNFRNAFILEDIMMTVWFHGAEILKKISDFHKMLNTLDQKIKILRWILEVIGFAF